MRARLDSGRRRIGGIRQSPNLRQEVKLQKCGMQLDDLPVIRGQGLDIYCMRQWRVGMDGCHDLLAFVQPQSIRQSRIKFDEGNVLLSQARATQPISSDYGGNLFLAGHASPAEVDGLLGRRCGGLVGRGRISVAELNDDILYGLADMSARSVC